VCFYKMQARFGGEGRKALSLRYTQIMLQARFDDEDARGMEYG